MPPPVVYVVVVIAATVAAGIGLYKLIKNGEGTGNRFSRRRRTNAPHGSSTGGRDDPRSPPGGNGAGNGAPARQDHGGSGNAADSSVVEMRDLRQSASAVRSPAMGTNLRNRHTRSNGNEAETSVIDASIADIPYTPLAPTPASRGDATPTASTPVASPPTSPFVIDSDEAATLTSPYLSPTHSQLRSLEDDGVLPSPPMRAVENNQLPTPSDSDDDSPAAQVSVLAPAEPELETPFEDRSPSPAEDPFSSKTLHAHTLAPSMSMHSEASSSSAISFNTALSPRTDYTALSPPAEFQSFPPTQLNSPFSDTMTLSASGDDDMYSFGSVSGTGSSESVHQLPHGEGDLQLHVQSPPQSEDGFVLHDFDEGSEGTGDSWEEVDERHTIHSP